MEADFLAWLRDRIGPAERVVIPIGDDAAGLRFDSRDRCVVSSDLLTEGVDFILAETEPARIGRKALAVNLSDLAAVAARPRAAIVSLAVPRAGAFDLSVALYAGLLPLAEQFDCPIAGGDTNCWDGDLVISVTVLGETTEHGPLLRSGGRPGDRILVTGELGGSILGRQFDFEPRVNEALQLNERYAVHAATDISDGLLRDLSHITDASGCGARLDVSQVPLAPAAHQLAALDGHSAEHHALHDGEDFELLLAVPADSARQLLADQPLDVRLTEIGELVPGAGITDGTDPLAPGGFQH